MNPYQSAPKLGLYCLQYRLSSDLQSDLCSYCLQYRLAQNISRFEERTTIEQWYKISNNVVCATNKASDQPAHMHSLMRAFASRLSIF